MADVEDSFSHLTGGKTKPWMWGAALGLAVLVYLYYKHSSAGTLASASTPTSTDPTAGANTSGGADSSLGSPSAGTSTTYNNYYIQETTPKPTSHPKPKPKSKPKPKPKTIHRKPTAVGGTHKNTLAHAQIMQSHPATHPAR